MRPPKLPGVSPGCLQQSKLRAWCEAQSAFQGGLHARDRSEKGWGRLGGVGADLLAAERKAEELPMCVVSNSARTSYLFIVRHAMA
jgi:hypothetical protein